LFAPVQCSGDVRAARATSVEALRLRSPQARTNARRETIKRCAVLGDDATADVFTKVVRAADKDIYFLQSHLQGGITKYGR
jgi:DNA-binding ferritin-like protein